MKKTKKHLDHSAGFTLIELMIALAVLSLVIAGYIQANITAQRNSEEMNERTVAIQDANRIIEEMRTIATSPGTFPSNVVTAYPNNVSSTPFTNLSGEMVTVSYTDPTENPLSATITVAWLSYTGRQNTTSIKTYITQR